MFDLDSAILQWRKRLSLRDGLTADDLDEIESHVRDEIESLVADGHSEKTGFYHTVRGFGQEEDLLRQFRIANWEDVVAQRTIYAPALVGNYVKLAFRSARRHKGFFSINLLGLAVGIACLILIMLYVQDELSYDRFHRDSDRIYRVVVDRINAGSKEARIQTPNALGLAMRREIPEIEQATRIMPSRGLYTLNYENITINTDAALMVDSTFFDVFSFSFLRGSAENAMANPRSIVLTESLARILFGDNDGLGKTVTVNRSRTLKVSGIIEDVPAQSHFQFDFLLQLPTRWDDCWSANCASTYNYVRIDVGADMLQVETKIQQLVEANEAQVRSDVYFMQPLTGVDGIHLASHRLHEFQPNGDILYIDILLASALFLILIAGMNYVNLATARSALRAKEIGLRKVVGARRQTLIWQFLTESTLMSVLAAVAAVGLALAVLPFLNEVAQTDLSLFHQDSLSVFYLVAVVVLIFGLASGLYPAIYLSSFEPISIFRNLRHSGRTRPSLRHYLVVFQFALAALLMVGALVVQEQLSFIESADLGFEKDQVIVIHNFNKVPRGDTKMAVRSALLNLAGVAKVGSTSELVGLTRGGAWGTLKARGTDAEFNVMAAHVDYGYLDALGIQLKEGRYFSPQFETDSSALAVILNETAVEHLNLVGPALGQLVDDSAGRTSKIVGVVENFHFAPLHKEIGPFAFFWYGNAGAVVVKMRARRIGETLEQIKATWSRFVPDFPMDYYFLDERIDQQYRSEQKFHSMFSVMTGLGLLIACLGMFGLAAFTAERRTKEIGLRKVLGARVSDIVTLLSSEFVKLVLLANLIAWPLSYWAMSKWLQDFAYHIEVGYSIFIVAAITAFVVAALTVGWQAVRTATANPVDSLKYQ
jgi:putative ABC transport system permease protein